MAWYRRMDGALSRLIDTQPVLAFLLIYAACVVVAYAVKAIVGWHSNTHLWFIMLGPPLGTVLGRRLRRLRSSP